MQIMFYAPLWRVCVCGLYDALIRIAESNLFQFVSTIHSDWNDLQLLGRNSKWAT